jgi:hypothetical protein
MARLSLSVAPEVKDDLFGGRADQLGDALARRLHAFSPAQPNEWLRLAALPNFSMK